MGQVSTDGTATSHRLRGHPCAGFFLVELQLLSKPGPQASGLLAGGICASTRRGPSASLVALVSVLYGASGRSVPLVPSTISHLQSQPPRPWPSTEPCGPQRCLPSDFDLLIEQSCPRQMEWG